MKLYQASHQWAHRPADERFTSLTALYEHFHDQRQMSRAGAVSSRALCVKPEPDHKGLIVYSANGDGYAPTNWAFGQLAARAAAPAGYLRTLPAEVAADCINWGLQTRDIEDVGVLLRKNGSDILAAVTGPNYGRIWNADIAGALVSQFGDGVTGDWRVPGEFGKAVTVTKENTTLYGGDRDMFAFLADEQNRIEIPNRRGGQSGSLARGFFVWNSETGSMTFGLGTFLFDYACCNRIVWGAEAYQEITIRHTASAPDKWLSEMVPALKSYAAGSATSVQKTIEDARAKRLDNVGEFLKGRFGLRQVETLQAIHQLEEGRPIETLWDAVTAVTAKARGIQWQDERVALERQAGQLLKLAA